MKSNTARKQESEAAPQNAQIELNIIERTALEASANNLQILNQQRVNLLRNIQEGERRHAQIIAQIEKDHGLQAGAIGTTHAYFEGHLVKQ